jgi:MFS family permease
MSLLKAGILITKRGFLVSTLVFLIFHTLHLIFSVVISQHLILSSNNSLLVQASFNFVVAITLILSSFLVDRINKIVSIYRSSLAIIFLTILLFFVPNVYLKIAVLLIIGAIFSIGLLGFLAYFWKLTASEERGRVSGFMGFIALPINFIVAYLIAPSLDFLGTVTLSIVVSLGIVVIVLLNPKMAMWTAKKKAEESYFEKRTVLLYAIPWIVFSLVNVTFAKNTSLIVSQQVSSSFHLSLLGLQFIGVIFGSIIGGIIADFFGRRLSLIFSLTAYGTSAALVGMFTSNAILFLVYLINGFSWGILFILYIFVVWGDLANKSNCAKMYSFGLATYYLTIGIGLVTQISIPIVVSSLATCLLVFLSNIPVALAPELLSSSFRERMGIRRHLNAVKKIGKQSN